MFRQANWKIALYGDEPAWPAALPRRRARLSLFDGDRDGRRHRRLGPESGLGRRGAVARKQRRALKAKWQELNG
jgi:hypothetical protein